MPRRESRSKRFFAWWPALASEVLADSRRCLLGEASKIRYVPDLRGLRHRSVVLHIRVALPAEHCALEILPVELKGPSIMLPKWA